MIARYDEAPAWVAHLAIDEPLIATGLGGARDALADALVRRARGEPFVLALAIEEPLARFARTHAAALLPAARGDRDRERVVLSAIGRGAVSIDGKAQGELMALDSDALAAAHFLWRLAPRVIVPTPAVYERLAALLGFRPPHVLGRSTLAPHAPVTRGEAIVVWAPERPRTDLAFIAFALAELHRPLRIISADTPAEHRHLDGAAGIIDASNDPFVAVALAGCGVGLAVDRACGANELVRGALVYQSWDTSSIVAGALALPGAPPPRPIVVALPPVRVETVPSGVETSVIVAFHRGRERLGRALASLTAQTACDSEIVVVNDAGDDDGMLRERFPSVRFLRRDARGGHAAALDSGVAAARGEAIAFLDYDDLVFPDHLARLIAARERSRLDVAYAATLVVHTTGTGDDEAIASAGPLLAAPFDRVRHRVAPQFPGMLPFLVARRALDAIGPFAASPGPAFDYAAVLRLAERVPFVFSETVTALYCYRGDANNASVRDHAAYPESYRAAWKAVALAPDPARDAARKAFLDAWIAADPGSHIARPSWHFREALPLRKLVRTSER